MATLSFADQVAAMNRQALEAVDKKIQSIAFEFFMSIVIETPVDKGALINNWFPNNGPSFSAETTATLSKEGHDSKARIYAMLGKQTFFAKDGALTMVNNLDYAYRAEVLGWPAPPDGQWSGKVGPYGMIAKSLPKAVAPYK